LVFKEVRVDFVGMWIDFIKTVFGEY